MTRSTAHEIQGASLVIRPNRSLPVSGIVLLFVGASAWALVVGAGFALAGASLILPFALLQALLVGLLCRSFYRHIDDCELITIEPDRVCVMKRQGTAVVRHEFPRHWVRLRLEAAGAGGRTRLCLGSHGRFVAVADEIGEAERAELARELQRLLRAPSATAAAPGPAGDART